MPADIEFKAIGLDELIKKAAALNGQMGPIVRDFLAKSAFNVEEKAKDLCPVDTGLLRTSITSKVGAGHIPDWASAGTNRFYARYVEFGTHKMRAQPYLRPGFHNARPDIDSNLEKAKQKIESMWK